jgi:hypothetical protein
MKYFSELTELENHSIELETHIALFNGFAQGMETLDSETAASGIHAILNLLMQDSKNIDNAHQQLFSAIREDTYDKPKRKK